MKRKIVQQGPATLMVSLPSKWAKSQGLRKGNEIDMEEEGASLILRTETKIAPEKLTIHVKDVKKFFDRMIYVPFRQGYDELEVTFDDPSAMPEIERKVEKLLGFEVIDHKERSCTIKGFAKVEEDDFDKLLRRVFRLVLGMAEDSAAAIAKGETKRLRAIGDIERTVEKFAQFCMRLINKSRSMSPKDATFRFASVWMVEQVSDNIAHLCNTVSDNNIKLRKETAALYKKITKLYADFYRLYYKPNIDDTVKLKETIKKLRKEAHNLMSNKESEPLTCMLNILDRINELSYLFV